MTTSPRLGFTELTAGQAVPETTVNEMLRYVEQMGNRAIVKDKDLATPPGSPSPGDAYIVAGSPTGDWSGWANRIAFRLSTAWEDITPIEGMRAYVQDEDITYTYSGSAWVSDNATTTELIRDTIGSALLGGEGIDVTVNDGSDTITVDWSGGEVNVGTPDTNDVLTWDGTEWTAAPAPGSGGGAGGTVPNGGTTGQALVKLSGVDQDADWGLASNWQLAGAGQTATGKWEFSVDGAKSNIDFTGLADYNELLIIVDAVTASSASAGRTLRFSVDNGSTFYTTSGDYVELASAGTVTNRNAATFITAGLATAVYWESQIRNMKGAVKFYTTSGVVGNGLFRASTSDINAIRITTTTADTMNGGKIYVYGR